MISDLEDEYCSKNSKIKPRSLSAEKKEKQDSQFQDDLIISDDKPVTIGICCMAKKSQSKEMQEILNRINTQFFTIEVFQESMILEDPIEVWPIVECFISFYSDGFPLNKAISYSELRKPFMINDLKKQQLLWDRQRVYTMLKRNKVPVPRHHFVIRNPEQYIIDDYNRKEIQQEIVKNYRTQKIDQEIIEEEDNVNQVINFLQSSDELTPISQGYSINTPSSTLRPSQTSKQLQELLLPKRQDSIEDTFKYPKSAKLRSYDVKALSEILDFKKNKKSAQLTEIEEGDDYLMIEGQKLIKPFVEKPFDAEDHNINIYYNSRDGGGCKKLFRKIGDQSSSFDPNSNSIRNDQKNYIYEEFLPTNGFDIKVYTVGEFYAHAEARKSPVLDGKVMRSENGKEVRYPVSLTMEEKMMAIKIVNLFGQSICGFDLLRSNNRSFVCDVNGWSFVKGNSKYYSDCASILENMILAKLRPNLLLKNKTDINFVKKFYKNSFRPSAQDLDIIEMNNSELRSVVAVFRHGDRTPKQKMKMSTTNPLFLQFFNDQIDPRKEIKLKHPKELNRLLDITRECISKIQGYDDKKIKLLQMKSVLEKGGHFEGINRKVQIKPLKIEKIEKNGVFIDFPIEILIILKWGGELTSLGEEDAVQLGQHFRHEMYPTDKDGLLRLHSTYRHDLKTYSSDEGRCQNTAAAFLKGLLGYEGEVTPILATMVQKNQDAQDLLDCNNLTVSEEAEIKSLLSKMLTSEEKLNEQIKKYCPEFNMSQTQSELLDQLQNPKQSLILLYNYIVKLTTNIRNYINLEQNYYISPSDMDSNLQSSETLTLFFKRWYKLEYDFLQKGKFNISKIPDIYDSVRYDLLHNQDKLQFYDNSTEFYHLAELLSQFMVPFEYGITTIQKLAVAKQVISPLCYKIKQDLLWWNKPNTQEEDYWKFRQSSECDLNSPWRHVRTRLYFTSASHLYSLFNIVYYGLGHYLIENNQKQKELSKITMLEYLSNIVIKLYEDLSANINDPNRFRVELSVSDGILMQCNSENTTQPKIGNIQINQNLRLDQLEDFLNEIIKLPIQ